MRKKLGFILSWFIFVAAIFALSTEVLSAKQRGQSSQRAALSKTSMKNVLFEMAEMRDIWFQDVDMSHAKIKGAKIINSRFQKSDFRHATFVGVRFDNVDFSGSEFQGARFVRCFFRDVKFDETNVQANQFVDPIFVP